MAASTMMNACRRLFQHPSVIHRVAAFGLCATVGLWMPAFTAAQNGEAIDAVNDQYEAVIASTKEADAKLNEALETYDSIEKCLFGPECQRWIDQFYLVDMEVQDAIVEVKGRLQVAWRSIQQTGLKDKLDGAKNIVGQVSTLTGNAKSVLDFTKRFNPEGSRGDPTRGLRLIGEIIGDAASGMPEPLDEIFGEYAKAAASFATKLTALQGALDNARQGSLGASFAGYADAQAFFEQNFEGTNGRTSLTFFDVTSQFRRLGQNVQVFYDLDGSEYYVYDGGSSTVGATGWIVPPALRTVYGYFSAMPPNVLPVDQRVVRIVAVSSARTTPADIEAANFLYAELSGAVQTRRPVLERYDLTALAERLLQNGRDAFIGIYLLDRSSRGDISRLRDALANTVFITGVVQRGTAAAAGVSVRLVVEGAGSDAATTAEDGSFTVVASGSQGDRFTLTAGSGAEQVTERSRFDEQRAFRDLTLQLQAVVNALSVLPAEVTINAGEEAAFEAALQLTDGSSRSVTEDAAWANGPAFAGREVGTFTVTATHEGQTGTATVTVEDGCPNKMEWKTDRQACGCVDPFTMSEELGECTDPADELEELTEDGEIPVCDASTLAGLVAPFDGYVADALDAARLYDAAVDVFYKAINDQTSNPCSNGLVALAFSQARTQAARAETIEADVTAQSIDALVEIGLCPPEDANAPMADVLDRVGEVGQALASFTGLAAVEAELQAQGCDVDEVADAGETYADQGVDPEVVLAGGQGATEICGDGSDNDGDGLIDEDCDELGVFNVTLVLFDSGSASDDVFGLSVSGQGDLGVTPEGGSRTYPLSLAPGDYVATVTVVSAPDNAGTFTLTVAEGDQVVASDTGAPGEGAVITVPFTIGADPTTLDPTLPFSLHSGDEVLQLEQQ